MKVRQSTLEPEIRRIGEALAARSAGHAPTVFNQRWWSANLLRWSMEDDDFKVRLFRFIDVLPCLQRDEQVTNLVTEYFGGMEKLAGPMHWGLRAISATRLGARLSVHSLRHQVEQMASTFIAGASIDSAMAVLAQLWRTGRACSVDLLGEATVSEREADQYRDRCLQALKSLVEAAALWPAAPLLEQDHLGTVPRIQLSVKLSALYSQLDAIDPEGSFQAVAARLRPIMDLAMASPASITLDMEQSELKDLTLMIFMRLLSEDAYRSFPHGGIAIQAYQKESAADVDRLIQWVKRRGAPVTIRLVKGAYWDSDSITYAQRGWPIPVFQTKAETDANYEALSRVLIEHADVIRPSFGTHNLRSLSHAEAAAQAAGLPAQACEYQMIFGMAEPLQSAVAESGRRLRIYTPVGELIPGMAYLVRRLLENTSNESVLRKEYVESASLDQLLGPPEGPELTRQRPGASTPANRSAEESEVTGAFTNEPHTNFSKVAARDEMARAITEVRTQLGRVVSYTVAHGTTPSGDELVTRNPSAPAEIVGRMRSVTPADLTRAVATAQMSFDQWSALPPASRVAILVKAADGMRRRRFELAAWEIAETGKGWREADADVAEAIDFLEFYAQEMHRLGQPRRLGHAPGELNHLMWSPRGLVAVIPPWNFPLAIPTGMVSAALVTGNVVLFKPSERAIKMGALLIELLSAAGIPDGALQFVPGGPEIGRALVSHPSVEVIAFTGSKDVGLQILAQAHAGMGPEQRSIKRVIAEMGGKNAIIVDETADLDEAITGVVTSFTGYQGQKCSACSRAIVHEAIYDQFLQRLTDAVMSLNIGPAAAPGHRMGPVIDERARAKVREYIQLGKREARLIVEREANGEGYYVGPTIFADVQPSHRLAQEEIFGPVLAVMRARDFPEAIRMANASAYALTGGVYSRSPGNILAARETFSVGNLYINRPITGALVGRQPFGGHQLSGVGAKAGGEDYLCQFMVARVVSENTVRRGFAPPT
jgi:RHH-type proline utilization regulon transcriptional repressor/proline dehydrogenase/delta 1-pyrroline-5-carboxylate dehydrogenase